MTAPSAARFNQRAFVSLVTSLCAAGLPVTGLANHQLQFAPMTSARHAWMSAHNSLGAIFVAFLAWHLVLNRRALAGHLRQSFRGIPGRELRYALAVVGVTTALVVGHALALS